MYQRVRTITSLKNVKLTSASLSRLGLLIFFWSLFDGTLTYMTPLVMESHGFSATVIGLLIGTSSLAGAALDFILCMFFRKANFKRLFLVMLVISFAYPMVISGASEVWGFLFAMALWGIYFDLYGFGVFNYVSQYVPKNQHASAFGTLQASRWMGNILAPLIAAALITSAFLSVFVAAQAFVIVAIACFVLLWWVTRDVTPVATVEKKQRSFNGELNLWKGLGRSLWAPLLVTFFLFYLDSFFWTLAPLYAQTLGSQSFGGLFLVAYSVPLFLAGVVVGRYAQNVASLKNAFFFLLFGSIILAAFTFFADLAIKLALIFSSAFLFGLALPSVNAAYAGLIAKAPKLEREIEALEDSSFNISYVLGPIAAGALADHVGIPSAFSLLGAAGIIIAVFLIVRAPQQILILQHLKHVRRRNNPTFLRHKVPIGTRLHSA